MNQTTTLLAPHHQPDAGLGRIRDQVAAAIAARRQLKLVGAGTKAFLQTPSGGREGPGAGVGSPGAGKSGNGSAVTGSSGNSDGNSGSSNDVEGSVWVLDCTQTRGIVSYEPSELVITVRAGTPLAEVEAALAEHRQCLPFEPPQFDGRATVGGMVAAGLSGPRRASAGAVRDYMLGTVLVDGRNRLLRFGGEVMKNVAGYDVSRLLAGSHGWFGVIAEVSLKVLPRPEVEVTLAQSLDADQAIRRFNQWGGQPLPISATSWFAGRAHIRLSGSPASVADAVGRIGGDRLDEARASQWWADLREQRHLFFEQDGPQLLQSSQLPQSSQSSHSSRSSQSLQSSQMPPSPSPLWRLSVPAVTAPLELGASQLIEWGGALRWCAPPAGKVSPERIRAAAAEVGGTAAIHRLPASVPQAYVDFPRTHPLSPVVAQIHRRLKDAFDPDRVFNPAADAVLGC